MTLSQCKKLKEWGLPQNKSRQYYRDDGKLFHCNEVGLIWADEEDQFAIPDLEQLLEFARGQNGYPFIKLYFSPTGGEWRAQRFQDYSEQPTGADPDPKKAVYKLLEKIMSPAVLSPPKRG